MFSMNKNNYDRESLKILKPSLLFSGNEHHVVLYFFVEQCLCRKRVTQNNRSPAK